MRRVSVIRSVKPPDSRRFRRDSDCAQLSKHDYTRPVCQSSSYSHTPSHTTRSPSYSCSQTCRPMLAQSPSGPVIISVLRYIISGHVWALTKLQKWTRSNAEAMPVIPASQPAPPHSGRPDSARPHLRAQAQPHSRHQQVSGGGQLSSATAFVHRSMDFFRSAMRDL